MEEVMANKITISMRENLCIYVKFVGKDNKLLTILLLLSSLNKKLMITFTIALLLLIGGYVVYGAYVNRIFGPDDRKTPAVTMADGVDYIPLPTWKIFMIQFLNIAGLGPIFGAIMGAQFGTASYLWIVLGTIFAGAVHDFFSGTFPSVTGAKACRRLSAVTWG